MATAPIFEVAVERIRRLFDRFDSVSFAVSGGKDSTVLLAAALTASEGHPIVASHNDYEATDPFTWQHLAGLQAHRSIRLRRFALPIRRNNHCSPTEPYWAPWNPQDEDRWVWPHPPAEPLPEGFNWTSPDLTARPTSWQLRSSSALWPEPIWGHPSTRCEVIGIRAAESLRRRQLLKLDQPGGHAHAWLRPPQDLRPAVAAPLAEATTADIWHAQHHHAAPLDLPENPYYRFAAKHLGRWGQKSRVHTGFDAVNVALFDRIGRDFPDWLERMLNRVAGVRTAARYGHTPLFGLGDYREAFPPGTNWEPLILNAVKRLAEPVRTRTLQTVRTSIRSHRKTTTDPIPDYDPHPISGLSWRGLHAVAVSPPPIPDEMILMRRKNPKAWINSKNRTADRYAGFGGGHTRKRTNHPTTRRD